MIRKFQNLRFLLIVVFVTKYSERIPVGIHGFRSIIVVETRGISPLLKHRLLPRCPHNFHRRRQVASRGIFRRCRILYDAPSDVLPKDTDVDGFETNDTDDNVATLRSVTFSNLPKDQGKCSIDYTYFDLNEPAHTFPALYLTYILLEQ